jgi:hypothetical protein
MVVFPCHNDDVLADAIRTVGVTIKATLALHPDARVIGYNVGFDRAHVEHHARRLNVTWPKLDTRKYDNKHILDLYQIVAGDDCEHVVSRSLVSVCRVYGVDVPEDDVSGADIATLYARGDWDGMRLHCQRDVERTVALARRLGVLPERYVALDIETVADPRMSGYLADPRAPGNLKDPTKIAAAIEEKRAAQIEKMALDPFASVPVVLAWQMDGDVDTTEAHEPSAFDAFLGMVVNDSVNAR